MSAVEFQTEGFREGLDLLNAGLHNGAHQALVAAETAAYDSAKNTTLFKDGPEAKLRNSIRKELLDALHARVVAGGHGVREARFVENGTAPHEIAAKGGGSLRFVVNGHTIFRRVVHHPGTQARPFMAEAAVLGEHTLEYGLDYFSDAAVAKFNSSG